MMSVSQLAWCCKFTDKNSYFCFLTGVVSWRSAAKVLFVSMLYHSFSICFRLIVLLRLNGSNLMKNFRFRSSDLIRKQRRKQNNVTYNLCCHQAVGSSTDNEGMTTSTKNFSSRFSFLLSFILNFNFRVVTDKKCRLVQFKICRQSFKNLWWGEFNLNV